MTCEAVPKASLAREPVKSTRSFPHLSSRSPAWCRSSSRPLESEINGIPLVAQAEAEARECGFVVAGVGASRLSDALARQRGRLALGAGDPHAEPSSEDEGNEHHEGGHAVSFEDPQAQEEGAETEEEAEGLGPPYQAPQEPSHLVRDASRDRGKGGRTFVLSGSWRACTIT